MTLITFVNEDEKWEETVNVRDDDIVNERDDYFSIY